MASSKSGVPRAACRNVPLRPAFDVFQHEHLAAAQARRHSWGLEPQLARILGAMASAQRNGSVNCPNCAWSSQRLEDQVRR